MAIQYDPKLELVSHTRHSRAFLSLCEDIKVAIGGLETRHTIFVIEYKDYDLVLGLSSSTWLSFAKNISLMRFLILLHIHKLINQGYFRL